MCSLFKTDNKDTETDKVWSFLLKSLTKNVFCSRIFTAVFNFQIGIYMFKSTIAELKKGVINVILVPFC